MSPSVHIGIARTRRLFGEEQVMVAVLVVMTIAALIALDYFVFRKRRAERDEVLPAMPGLLSSATPSGVQRCRVP